MTRECTQCGKVTDLSNFYKKVGGKFGLQPTCKDCSNKVNKKQYRELLKQSPWINSYYGAKSRCENKHNKDYPRYGKRGIKFRLSKKEMQKIWSRDKAGDMKSSALHRQDSNGDYTLANCKFIELVENSKIGNSRAITQRTLKGEVIKIWTSQAQIVKEFPANQSLLGKAIKANRKYKGYLWGFMDEKKLATKNLIYKTIVGSYAYGLNTITSDVDIKGIFIPDKNHYFGLSSCDQVEFNADYTIFSIKKFIKLASGCNPNIIEVLFVDKKNILFMNKYGKMLRDNRNLFLTKRARYTFGGYAYAQLKRIKGHRKWIMNPQTLPKKKDFFREKTIILENKKKKTYMKFLEHEYDLAIKKYQQYQTWKRERNPERAKLENQYGYDCKHGMHLIRLLRMGCEILEKKKVIVNRPDREELLAIRNGKVSYDELIKQAEHYYNRLEELYETSKLPKKPKYHEINRLLISITEDFFNDSR